MTIESALGDYSTALTPQQFGAVGDGSSHPVSVYFADHLQARNYYSSRFGISDVSFITSASQEMDEVGIQAAINSLPTTGGTVRIPAGTYKLTNGLSTNQRNLELRGEGGPGLWSAVGLGATQLVLSGAIVGFTFNSAAAATIFNGPTIRNLAFVCDSSSTGGILIKRANNYLLDNVTVTGATAGYGVKHDGTGNVNQYGVMTACNLVACQKGTTLTSTNGLRVIGCYFDFLNQGSVEAGTTGIEVVSGDTLYSVGNVIQYYAIGVDVQQGDGAQILGGRFEGFTSAVQIANSNGAVLIGGTFSNTVLGAASGTGITIAASCANPTVLPGLMSGISTNQSNSSVSTNLRVNPGVAVVTTTRIQVQNGASVFSGSGTPEGAVSSNVGGLYLRTDGGASTTLYVKESGAGNTGWVAK